MCCAIYRGGGQVSICGMIPHKHNGKLLEPMGCISGIYM